MTRNCVGVACGRSPRALALEATIQRLPAYRGRRRATPANCPVTDKVWAAHLGFSLGLSLRVLGISFHATGYVIADPWVRPGGVRGRAHGVHVRPRALPVGWSTRVFSSAASTVRPTTPDRGRPPRRFFRITIRLTISFALAWIIAVFLELAIFSDTISEKVKRDHLAGNQPIFQKIELPGAARSRDRAAPGTAGRGRGALPPRARRRAAAGGRAARRAR